MTTGRSINLHHLPGEPASGQSSDSSFILHPSSFLSPHPSELEKLP
jgi:hypothetical protein